MDFYGHVNNATYVQYLEFARVEMLYAAGVTFDAMFKARNTPVVANVNINYKHSAKLHDEIVIYTHVSKLGNTSFTVRHEGYNLTQGNVLSFDADVVLVFIDLQTGKPQSIPEALKEKFRPQ